MSIIIRNTPGRQNRTAAPPRRGAAGETVLSRKQKCSVQAGMDLMDPEVAPVRLGKVPVVSGQLGGNFVGDSGRAEDIEGPCGDANIGKRLHPVQ